jgi:hypothetical protein
MECMQMIVLVVVRPLQRPRRQWECVHGVGQAARRLVVVLRVLLLVVRAGF